MYDIVFYEVFREEEKALKKYLPKKRKALFFRQAIQEQKFSALPSSFISIRTQSTIPLLWAKALTGILTRSTGYDHLLGYLRRTETRAALGYLPGYCSRSVAEQAMLMLMALWRRLNLQQKSFHRFTRDNLTGEEIKGKNLLVVGVGRIGGEAVDIGRGLGMHVKGVDIAPSKKGLVYTTLSSGLGWADAVICAVPLTDKTHNMFHYQRLQRARKGLALVNIARGELTPLNDMKRLLKEKRLGGLGLDVYEQEADVAVQLRSKGGLRSPGLEIIRELEEMPNVIFTPHNAFNTHQALDRKAKDSIASVEAFFKRKKFPNPVPSL